MLNNSNVQTYVAQTVVKSLSNKLHTDVRVGKIEYKLFNSISIDSLYVQDLHKDTLFFSKNIHANFNLWKFFHGEIHVTSVVIDQFYGNLVVDTLGKSNLNFIIEAFKPTTKNDSSKVTYQIEHLTIKNSRFDYFNQGNYKIKPKGGFNGNDLKFSKINTELILNVLTKDSLNAEVIRFSAEEKSGLKLTDFNTEILVSNKQILLPYLNVVLPKSNLSFDEIKLDYDSLADFKKFGSKVKLWAPIKKSVIYPSDLSCFVPEFKKVRGNATLSGLISGRIGSLRFQKIDLRYGKTIRFNADVDINGLPNFNEAFIFGQINDLQCGSADFQDFMSDVNQKPFVLPKELIQLGLVKYTGNITGFTSNLVAYGNIKTDLGSISTDILIQLENKLKDLKYNGTIKANNFKLGRMLRNETLGNVSFKLNTKGFKNEKSPIQGVVKADVAEIKFKDYTYKDIKFNGKYDGTGFDGNVEIDDKNIHAKFNGIIDLTKKMPVFDFNLQVSETDFQALNLIKVYPGAKLSFIAKTNMVGNSLDNINGNLQIDSILFVNKQKELQIGNVKFVSRIEKGITNFAIESDFINGSFNGDFKYSSISQTINQIVQNYLPALALRNTSKSKKYPNHINLDLTIQNTDNISEVLELPYFLTGVSTINGYIDDKTNKVDIYGNFPEFRAKKRILQNITLHLESQMKQLKLTTRAQYQEKVGLMNLYLLASAAQDSIGVQMGWQNNQQVTNAGEIQTTTKIFKENDKTGAIISILPTQIIISDSVWDIHRSTIKLNSDSTIQINNFRFDSHNQYVHVNGVASNHQSDSIAVEMNDLNLDFVMRMLTLKGIKFGGKATGTTIVRNILSQPIYEANIQIKELEINHKLLGEAKLHSSWDKVNKQVLASATFIGFNKDTIALADGVFIPKTDSLDFLFDARNLSIEFLTPYFESVVQNVKGFGSGFVRMFGPSKILGFEGNVFINKGQASVNMLKTTYFFNDTVRLTRKAIKFNDITVYDQEKNKGQMTGMLTHNGVFKKMNYNVYLKAKNILALNTQAEDNDYFFGKAYANGNVHIFGDEEEANIVVVAATQPHTKCYILMGGASSASDNSFIRFEKKKTSSEVQKELVHTTKSNFNVKVNLQLDVTPDAEMELIIDPKGGDMITGKGDGNLRVEFDTFSDIKLYGTYTINYGYYLFTLQNVIRKEFKIDNGSTLSWVGNPFEAKVDIRALYPLSASLKDLDQSLLSSNRSSIPVNCVLKLTDDLMKPTINFDIDLPQSDENVKQQVKGIINTDEMMNRQILYLLLFNKFFTPEYLRNTSSASNSLVPNEAVSFALSTLSAQVNSWFSQVFNNLSLGFDYQRSEQVSTDYQAQAQILYQPNNRLIVNGNIGYRNDNLATSTNANKFIGDVDIEYLLNESGNLRFKAYNHTIDRYQLRTARFTQGVGFLYKEDFASVDELFKYYWKLLTGKGKANQNEEIQK